MCVKLSSAFLLLQVSGGGNLITWLKPRIKVLSVEWIVKVMWQIEHGKKKADVYREFSLVNSTIQTIRRNRTIIINAFEQNGSRINRFRKPEQCIIIEALRMWFTQQRSDNVPMSSPLRVTVFVLPNF